MTKYQNALVVFAKDPSGNRIKTRLKGFFSLAQRRNLYLAFLKDTHDLCKKISGSLKILAFDSKGKPKQLKKIFSGFIFISQKGADLGKRMHRVFFDNKKNGLRKTVIIGSDSPDLPAALIKSAFKKLSTNDLVLGPSTDGGYYLIGLKEPHKELFEGIPWSTDKVFKSTLERARNKKLKLAILKKWSDVDRPQDLASLKRRLQRGGRANHTKEFFDG